METAQVEDGSKGIKVRESCVRHPLPSPLSERETRGVVE